MIAKRRKLYRIAPQSLTFGVVGVGSRIDMQQYFSSGRIEPLHKSETDYRVIIYLIQNKIRQHFCAFPLRHINSC